MTEWKIEPGLLTEMRRLEAQRDPSAIPVVIQLKFAEPPAESTNDAALAQRLAVHKEAVLNCLSRHGFTGTLRENVLAGSLESELTRDQIAALSDLQQVKRIIFNRLYEGVTL